MEVRPASQAVQALLQAACGSLTQGQSDGAEFAKFAIFPLGFFALLLFFFFSPLNFGKGVNGKLGPVLLGCVRQEGSAQIKLHASTDLASGGRASMHFFFLGRGGVGWLLRVTWNTILFFCTSTHTHARKGEE